MSTKHLDTQHTGVLVVAMSLAKFDFMWQWTCSLVEIVWLIISGRNIRSTHVANLNYDRIRIFWHKQDNAILFYSILFNSMPSDYVSNAHEFRCTETIVVTFWIILN